MRPIYETEVDRAREKAAMKEFAALVGLVFDDLERADPLEAWDYLSLRPPLYFEVKCRNFPWGRFQSWMMPQEKYRRLMSVSRGNHAHAIYVVETRDAIGWTDLTMMPVPPVRMGGRTVQTRDAMDVCPTCYIPLDWFFVSSRK